MAAWPSGSSSPRTTSSCARACSRLIDAEPELELVAACGDYDELLEAIEKESPDVVLTDIRMPPTGTDEGIRAAGHLRQNRPEIGVVVLSQYAEPAYALDLLEDGSEGRAYLLKERVSDVDQLLARHPGGGQGRQRDRPQGRRGAGRGPGPGGQVTARPA